MNFLINIIFTLCLSAPRVEERYRYFNDFANIPHETKRAIDDYFDRWVSVMTEALSRKVVSNACTMEYYTKGLGITERHMVHTEVKKVKQRPGMFDNSIGTISESYSKKAPETFARLGLRLLDLRPGSISNYKFPNDFSEEVEYTITVYFFHEHGMLPDMGTQHKATLASMGTQTNEEAEIQSRTRHEGALASMGTQTNEEAEIQSRLDFHHAEALHHQSEIKRLESQLARQKNDIASELECVICKSSRKSVVFLPCSHMNTCNGCAQTLQQCPICRSQIVTKTNVFL